ncbi:hypothetical protein [Micromonospora okii]|uniref:hypothetical protein n=1 Tax=Micromonospora okii TaxID=1182970 RepID=UPI001E3034B6|nr:hypothetical protein [Micromonospora okii]
MGESYQDALMRERRETLTAIEPFVKAGIGMVRYLAWMAVARQGVTLADWRALSYPRRERVLIADRKAGGCRRICPIGPRPRGTWSR